MLKSTIQSFPKAELHCHLDGSIRPKTLQKIANQQGLFISPNLQEVTSKMEAPENCQNLVDYLTCFDYVLPYLQTAKALEMAAYDVMEQAFEDGIRYIEIRFAPILSMEKGLTVAETIEAVAKGIAQAEKEYPIFGNILVIGMKTGDLVAVQEIFEQAIAHNHKKVVGYDLAGAEADHFLAEYEAILKVTTENGDVLLTLHAGECGCVHNVLDVVTAGTKRIGHGTALKGNHEAQIEVARAGVCVEGCPTSNVQTRVIDSIVDYPFKEWFDNRVTFCINTDNRTVSNTTLTNEYDLLLENHDLTQEQLRELNQNAIRYSFADDYLKEQLLKEMTAFVFNK